MRKDFEATKACTGRDGIDAPTVAAPELSHPLPDGLLFMDNDGLIRKANRAVAELAGYTTEDLEGRPVEFLVALSRRERHAYLRESYVQSPGARPMGPGLEIGLLTKYGSEVPVDIALLPFEMGEVAGCLAVVRDASRRDAIARQLSRARHDLSLGRHELAKLQHDLRALLFASGGPGATLGPDGRIRHANRDLCTLLRIPPASLQDTNLFDLLRLDDTEGILHTLLSEKRLVGPVAASMAKAQPGGGPGAPIRLHLLPLVSTRGDGVSEILVTAVDTEVKAGVPVAESWLVDLVSAGASARTPLHFLRAACRIADGLLPGARCDFFTQLEDGSSLALGHEDDSAHGTPISADLALGFTKVFDREQLRRWAAGYAGREPLLFEAVAAGEDALPRLVFALWEDLDGRDSFEHFDQLETFLHTLEALYAIVTRTWLQELAAATISAFEHAVVLADFSGRLVHANPEALASLSVPDGGEEARRGWLNYVSCSPPLFSPAFLEMLAADGGARLTGRVERPGRTPLPVEISARALSSAHSAPDTVLLILRNASRLEEMEGFAHHVALYDGITGLPNLGLATGRLEQALGRRNPETVGLLAIQVTRLERIRVALGPTIADEIIQELAARLVSSARAGEIAARLGTDDFSLLLLGIEGKHDLERRAELLSERLRRPILTSGGEVFATFKIGAARGAEGCSAEDLLSRASARSRNDSGTQAHDPLVTVRLDRDRASASIDLEMALHRAVLNREFIAHFQPQVSLAGRTTVGAEVLVRWQRVQGSLVPPSEFLATAERVGIVSDIGRMMLEQARGTLGEWGAQGLDLTLSVNVSGHQLLQPGFPNLVTEMIAASSFEPGRLTLEVTETDLMADLGVATAQMRRLRDLGVGLAIDDFGTGYSSLTYLRKLPFTEMKLDRSFISGLGSDAGDEAIVSSAVTLGQTFGIRTVAEGVETELQYSRLTALGCDAAQGYLFGKPMPLRELERRLGIRAKS